ncbi:hypothetical protein [Cohnella herbarum]|uniref:Uncharacterized protein n=1 Tax=Cohnella herbarum TaxID=2728023 RepID=A0A7Z2VG04_9BACL|nr:hypothetical protein [Cohnella herbarum]QJD82488.1 hypothetical protein HH215_04325 [Cohnella herbarum]
MEGERNKLKWIVSGVLFGPFAFLISFFMWSSLASLFGIDSNDKATYGMMVIMMIFVPAGVIILLMLRKKKNAALFLMSMTITENTLYQAFVRWWEQSDW